MTHRKARRLLVKTSALLFGLISAAVATAGPLHAVDLTVTNVSQRYEYDAQTGTASFQVREQQFLDGSQSPYYGNPINYIADPYYDWQANLELDMYGQPVNSPGTPYAFDYENNQYISGYPQAANTGVSLRETIGGPTLLEQDIGRAFTSDVELTRPQGWFWNGYQWEWVQPNETTQDVYSNGGFDLDANFAVDTNNPSNPLTFIDGTLDVNLSEYTGLFFNSPVYGTDSVLSITLADATWQEDSNGVVTAINFMGSVTSATNALSVFQNLEVGISIALGSGTAGDNSWDDDFFLVNSFVNIFKVPGPAPAFLMLPMVLLVIVRRLRARTT